MTVYCTVEVGNVATSLYHNTQWERGEGERKKSDEVEFQDFPPDPLSHHPYLDKKEKELPPPLSPPPPFPPRLAHRIQSPFSF